MYNSDKLTGENSSDSFIWSKNDKCAWFTLAIKIATLPLAAC